MCRISSWIAWLPSFIIILLVSLYIGAVYTLLQDIKPGRVIAEMWRYKENKTALRKNCMSK